jgi:predicted CXXCH cytochrome family protein
MRAAGVIGMVAAVGSMISCRSQDEAPKPPAAAAPPATRATTAPAVARLRPEHVAPGTSCTTAGCHADLTERPRVHGPVAVGGCDACHQAEQPGHKFPLKREGDALCTLCHVVMTGKPFAHAAIRQAGCVGCHDPHGSDLKFLIAGETPEQSCRTCHPATETGKFRHGPFAAGACTVCHQPHEADNAMLTIRTGPAHCFRCHHDMQERMEKARTVHPPARDSCTGCHAPHASEFARLLKAEPSAQCASCHREVDTQARTATSKHGAVFTAKECLNCHDVHAAGQPMLLRSPMPDVCLTCHDQPQRAYDGRMIPEMKTKLTKSEFVHGPIRSGACNECHQVHGSSNNRLLKKYFADSFYKDFDLTNYALCFSCHEKALVLDQKTTQLTGFRNGDANLHYVHVNRLEKGRSCKACHEIHGSDVPKHMARDVPFEGGGWALPINFRKTPTGGGCAPGCHQPYEYDRDTPVEYPARK